MSTEIETIGRTFDNIPLAQQAIGDMVKRNGTFIKPCGGCENSSRIGCTKISFVTSAGEKEVGPLFDAGRIVCPSQKGALELDEEEEFLSRAVIFQGGPKKIKISPARIGQGAWDHSQKGKGALDRKSK